MSSKPEGSTDWRIKTTATVTYLKVLSPGGVRHLVIPGSVIPQQGMYTTATTDGTTAKAIMSTSHSPYHGHNVTDIESGTFLMSGCMYCM